MILDDCIIRKWTAREYSLFGGISLCPGMSGLSGFVSSLQPGFESRAHHVCFSDLINIVIFIQLCNNYREKLTTWQKFGKNHWQPFFFFLFFFLLSFIFYYRNSHSWWFLIRIDFGQCFTSAKYVVCCSPIHPRLLGRLSLALGLVTFCSGHKTVLETCMLLAGLL